MLKEFVAIRRKQFLNDQLGFTALLTMVSRDLMKCDQFAAAETTLRECLTIREKVDPKAWTTFNTMSLLGGALLAQKKFADAEPLLIEGYQGMKARAKSIPAPATSRLPDAVDRLIDLYTATDNADQLAKWQAERVKYPAAKIAESK